MYLREKYIINMKSKFFFILLRVIASMAMVISADASAKDQSAALNQIDDFVKSVCPDPSLHSSTDRFEGSADFNVGISRLMSKLASLGFEASGIVKREVTEGVLQRDLASLAGKSVDCRKELTIKLIDSLLGPSDRAEVKGRSKTSAIPASSLSINCGAIANGDNNSQSVDCRKYYGEAPRRKDGLYQDGALVGDVQGGDNIENNLIKFSFMHFSNYVDPGKPLEFGDLRIECPDAPRRTPGRYVGTLSVVTTGGVCKVIP